MAACIDTFRRTFCSSYATASATMQRTHRTPKLQTNWKRRCGRKSARCQNGVTWSLRILRQQIGRRSRMLLCAGVPKSAQAPVRTQNCLRETSWVRKRLLRASRHRRNRSLRLVPRPHSNSSARMPSTHRTRTLQKDVREIQRSFHASCAEITSRMQNTCLSISEAGDAKAEARMHPWLKRKLVALAAQKISHAFRSMTSKKLCAKMLERQTDVEILQSPRFDRSQLGLALSRQEQILSSWSRWLRLSNHASLSRAKNCYGLMSIRMMARKMRYQA